MAASSSGSPAPEADGHSIPVLLREARSAYGDAIRSRLAEADLDDLPRNAPYVLAGMAHHAGSAVELIRELGVTKQAASQLIDTLVVRGYLRREVNLDDRRRMTVELTDRGRAAAALVRAGVEEIDAQLADACSATERDGLRAGLVALAGFRDRYEAGGV